MTPAEILYHSMRRGKWASYNIGTPYKLPPVVVEAPTPVMEPEHRCKRTMPRAIFRVLEVVGDAYKITPDELVSPQRTNRIVRPRHVAFYILHRDMKRSLPKIGRWFGGRDHTTVLHGVRQVDKRLGAITDILTTIRGRLQ